MNPIEAKESHESLIQAELPSVYRKSNSLITAKYNLPMICNQIMVITCTRLQEDGNQMRGRAYAGELRSLLGAKDDTNFYKKLKLAAEVMEGTRIFIDLGEGNFESFVIVTNSSYRDGVFDVLYNKEMTPYLKNVMRNYTKLEMSIILNFENRYFYRLYELLKKDAYKIGPGKNSYTAVTYEYHHLRALLGLIDLDQDYIRTAVSSKKYTWEQIADDICKKEHQKSKDFRDFRKRILDPAQETLLKDTDICFEYKLNAFGRGRKVHSITFHIYKNDLYSTNKVHPEITPGIGEEITDYNGQTNTAAVPPEDGNYLALRALLEEIGTDTSGFTQKYYRKLLSLAGNEVQVIRDQIEYSKSVAQISNYYGWLTEAVKNRYSENTPVPTFRGSTEAAKQLDELNKTVNSAATQSLVWDCIKNRDNFKAFVKSLMIPEDKLEGFFKTEELINLYFDFSSGSQKNKT